MERRAGTGRAGPGRCALAALAVLVVTLPLLIGGACQQSPEPARGAAVVGQPAPGFTLETLDGGRVVLKNLRGSVVVVDFWATWCPPCRESLRHLEEIRSRFMGRDLEIVTVAVESKKESVDAFVRENGITGTVAFDDGATAKRYGVQEVPALFLLDRNGTIVHWAAGFNTALAERVDGWIEEALSGAASPGGPGEEAGKG